MSNAERVMAEYRKQEAEFVRRTGSGYTFGGKESRKIIADIVKSGKIDVTDGSLKEGLREIDQTASLVRSR